MEQIESGSADEIASAVAHLRGSVRRATFTAEGCRVVQTAFEVARQSDGIELVGELRGCVRSAVTSPYGNYVIQKVIELMPPSSAGFVVEELLGHGVEIARHRFGCRSLCRLLEHYANNPSTVQLIDEVLVDARRLCRQEFGHFVIESILENGLPAQTRKVAAALQADLSQNLSCRSSTCVMEKALIHCGTTDRHSLAASLLSRPKSLAALAEDNFGTNVLRAMLRLPGENASVAQTLLQNAVAGCMPRDRRGKQVWKELQAMSSARAI